MSELNSAEYYQKREQQHRVLAGAATSRHIAAIHRDMAERYSKLVQLADPGPPLRLVLPA